MLHLGRRARMAPRDTDFVGSVPEVYDRVLVPLIFEEHAADLAARVPAEARAVLEVAAGSGVLTRVLADTLPSATEIIATDLNAPMLERARSVGTSRPVEWKVADVMDLPFEAEAFDAVVCQFSVMFFPDKTSAFAEMARVLRPGGVLLFNVWDRIEANEFADEVTKALAERWPDDPPRFLARTPHGYWEESVIRADLAAAGVIEDVAIDVVEARSVAAHAADPAIAYCMGTPLRGEIEARGLLEEALASATSALAARFGHEDLDGLVRGFAVSARKVG
jgi:SAM-dependent methyltransferase